MNEISIYDASISRWVDSEIRLRRSRLNLFRAELMGEPVWAILLELFARKLRNQDAPLHEIVEIAETFPSTALRFVSILIGEDLVSQAVRESDGVTCLQITDKASAGFVKYVSEVVGEGEGIPPAINFESNSQQIEYLSK